MNPQARVSRARRPLAALLAATFLAVGVPAPQARADEEPPTVTLALRDCLDLALGHNLDIAVQRYNVQVTGTEEDSARSVYDSLLSSSYTQHDNVSENVNPFSGQVRQPNSDRGRQFSSIWNDPTVWGGNFTVGFFAGSTRSNNALLVPFESTALSLGYQQSLLRNFGLDVNRAPITIAQNNSRISEAQFRDTVMTTVQATENAYWDLVFARMNLDVTRQSLKLAQDLLRMNKAKVEVGTMAPIDVTQAEAGVASREEGVIVAEAGVRNAEDALRRLLNPPSDSPIWSSVIVPVDSPSFEPMNPDAGAAIESAKKNRPELEQQRIANENSRLQEQIDRKATRWDLKAQAQYATEGLAGGTFFIPGDANGDGVVDPGEQIRQPFDEGFSNSLGDLDRSQFADWSIGVQLDIPLGNRAAKARYTATSLRLQQSDVQLQNLELAAEIDVRAKVRDVNTNIKRVEAARKNRELQDKNVEAEQKKFDNGMSTSFTVLQIQDDLANAQSRENLAIIDYNKSLVSLERSKGTLLEARQIQVAARSDQAGT